MLEDDGLEAVLNGAAFSLDPEHSQDVSVFGNDFVSFDGVVVEFAVVDKLKLGLRVGALCNYQ